jgi:uncharacterized protein YecT (DUF1311 family)
MRTDLEENNLKKITVFVYAVVLCFCFIDAGKVASAYVKVENHPIDIELEKKIDEDSSTYGMMEAYQWSVQEWDKLLNKNYNALMKKLSKEELEKLRATQREWIKYRDLEFVFNGEYWSGFEGTMYRVFPAAFQSDFVRERALRLGYYLEDLDDR